MHNLQGDSRATWKLPRRSSSSQTEPTATTISRPRHRNLTAAKTAEEEATNSVKSRPSRRSMKARIGGPNATAGGHHEEAKAAGDDRGDGEDDEAEAGHTRRIVITL